MWRRGILEAVIAFLLILSSAKATGRKASVADGGRDTAVDGDSSGGGQGLVILTKDDNSNDSSDLLSSGSLSPSVVSGAISPKDGGDSERGARSATNTGPPGVPEGDLKALLALKASVDDPLGVLSNWSDSSDPCLNGWPGVECRGVRVHRISLPGFRLKGRLPAKLAMADALETIELPGNRFTGKLPMGWGTMKRLKMVDLRSNNLTGPLPRSWQTLNKLETVLLDVNQLSGKLPSDWWLISSLSILSLPGNKFEGALPVDWHNLNELKYLNIASNKISGTLPRSWSRLPKLQVLHLSDNMLFGRLPADWGQWRSITDLQLYGNNLVGPLPREWGSWDQVKAILLQDNNLARAVPDTWAATSRTATINLSNNLHLCGSIPEALQIAESSTTLGVFLQGTASGTECTNQSIDTQALLAFKATITGDKGGLLDTWKWKRSSPCEDDWEGVTCIMGRVAGIDVSNKGLQATAAPQLSEMDALAELDVSSNRITGELPSSWGSFPTLKSLNVSKNMIFGTIPESWNKMSTIEVVDVSANQLIGILPSSWSEMKNVRVLNVSDNALDGALPVEWSALKSLEVLQLHKNIMTGALPPSWSKMTQLQALDASHNQFIGPVPEEWGNMQTLEKLSLSGNHGLCGDIPKSLPIINDMGRKASCARNVTEAIILTNFKASVNDPSRWLTLWKANSMPCSGGGWAGVMCDNGHVVGLQTTGFNLSGPLPSAFADLIDLEFLELSENVFTGVLPEEWSKLKKLKQLNLSTNSLEGELPPTWKGMKNLETLDISSNSLTGSYPSQWLTLKALKAVTVSGNEKMCGELPNGLPEDFTLVAENSSLMQPCGKMDEEEEDDNPPRWAGIVMGLVAGIGVLVLVLGGVLILRWRKRRQQILARHQFEMSMSSNNGRSHPLAHHWRQSPGSGHRVRMEELARTSPDTNGTVSASRTTSRQLLLQNTHGMDAVDTDITAKRTSSLNAPHPTDHTLEVSNPLSTVGSDSSMKLDVDQMRGMYLRPQPIARRAPVSVPVRPSPRGVPPEWQYGSSTKYGSLGSDSSFPNSGNIMTGIQSGPYAASDISEMNDRDQAHGGSYPDYSGYQVSGPESLSRQSVQSAGLAPMAAKRDIVDSTKHVLHWLDGKIHSAPIPTSGSGENCMYAQHEGQLISMEDERYEPGRSF